MNTGIALFRKGRLVGATVLEPLKRSAGWQVAAVEHAQEIAFRLAGEGHLIKVVVEFPRLFGGAAGHMVAARGDLGKLYYMCGAIAGALAERVPQARVELVDVNHWKGTMPKEVCWRLVRKELLSRKSPLAQGKPSHDWDAIGLGMWALGGLYHGNV